MITDEAYERCIHDGELASAWGAPNVILIRSLGKSLAMPAWRIGFVAAEPSVIDACLRELEWDVIRVSHVAQRAATAALEGPQGWLDEVAQRYRRDRDAAHAMIAEHPILSASLPAATPFLWLELGELSSDDLIAEGLPGRRRRRLRHSRLRAAAFRRLCDAPMADDVPDRRRHRRHVHRRRPARLRRHAADEEGAVDARRLRPRRRPGHPRAAAGDRSRAGERDQGRPRDHGRLERGARRQGIELLRC